MENIEIETTQNVDIQYNIASIGDRVVAQIIDLLIVGGYAIAMIFILSFIGNMFSGSPYYYPTATFIVLYLPFFLYDFLCELFLNGQSFGKKLIKIKVVKIDGSQPGIGSYFLRWLIKPVDVFFTYGSVGIITMLINGKGQRLGDLAANTTVIKLKQEVKLEEILLPKTAINYEVKFPQVILLSDKDIQVIKDVLNYRKNTDAFSYQNILEKAKVSISNKMGVQSEMNALFFLDTIIKDYSFLNSN
ncbi:MAG: RDD family protein [Ignavibacteriaceae bacterium]